MRTSFFGESCRRFGSFFFTAKKTIYCYNFKVYLYNITIAYLYLVIVNKRALSTVRECMGGREYVSRPFLCYLNRMRIEITPYNTEWPTLFYNEREQLEHLLNPLNPHVEHIGSTAVPRLVAKPVIDIMVGLPTGKLDEVIPLFRDQPYHYVQLFEDELPERRFYVKLRPEHKKLNLPAVIRKPEEWPNHLGQLSAYNIHIVEVNGPFWVRHLLFRNFLRQNAEARQAYGDFKLRLAREEWKSTRAYAEAKTEFIEDLMVKARQAEGL